MRLTNTQRCAYAVLVRSGNFLKKLQLARLLETAIYLIMCEGLNFSNELFLIIIHKYYHHILCATPRTLLM